MDKAIKILEDEIIRFKANVTKHGSEIVNIEYHEIRGIISGLLFADVINNNEFRLYNEKLRCIYYKEN